MDNNEETEVEDFDIDEEDYEVESPMGFGEMMFSLDSGVEEEKGTVDEVVVEEEVIQETEDAIAAPIQYIAEDWVPPNDADINWYKEKYNAVHEAINGEEMAQKVKEAHLELITAQEADVTEFRDLYKAYKSGDVDFLRMSFPNELVKIGINPILHENEIDTEIDTILQKEFGEDYADIYDQKQVIKPGSISAKIFNRSQELSRTFEQENKDRQSAYESYIQTKGTQQQSVPPDLNELYKPLAKEMPRAEFDSLIETIKTEAPNWTVSDYRKVLTYDADIAKARTEGAEAERAKLTGELRKSGNARPVSSRKDSDDRAEPVEIDTKFGRDFSDIFRDMLHG